MCAVDVSWNAPALHLAEAAWQVPSCRSPEFIPFLLELCQRERIGLLIPTIDTELGMYAAHREAFRKVGATVAVSGPATIRIAEDKVITQAWLVSHGFPTVRQALARDVLARPEGWNFPLIVKPRFGSAGKGVEVVHSWEALRMASDSAPTPSCKNSPRARSTPSTCPSTAAGSAGAPFPICASRCGEGR